MTTAQGIDVSGWQHPRGAPIDWSQVKESDIECVMIKSSQGVGYVNPFFGDDYAGAKEAGLLVGAYHFAQPGLNTWEAESEYALGVVSGKVLDLGLALDLEQLGKMQPYEAAPWVENWLKAVTAVVGLSPLYIDQSLLALITGAPWGYPLWIADPSARPEGTPWMRQTGTGAVAGITVATDLDTFYGVRGVNPTPPTPPVPVPVPEPVPPVPPAPVPPVPQPVPPVEVAVNVPQLSVTTPGPTVVEPACKALQAALLGKWSIAVGPTGIDGRYGPATADAVKELQTHGAGAAGPVDGICGAQTWSYLIDG